MAVAYPKSLMMLIVCVALGCGSENGAGDPDMDLPDSTKPPIQTQRWTSGLLEGGNMGLHPRVARAPDGKIAAAWMAIEGREDGPCTELGGDDPPIRVVWSLRYAEFNAGSWTAETVGNLPFVGQPPGIDLTFDQSSAPLIGAMAGAPNLMFRYCGVNDAAIYRRSGVGNWTPDIAVRESGEAVTGEEASDFGSILGYWPAVAVASNGDIGLAYKDVHAGGLQSDDFRKADLEFAIRRGTSWTPSAVDIGRGGGNFTKMLFDLQDRPVITQYIPTEDTSGALTGVWLHRSEDGMIWDRVQLHNQPTSAGPTIAIDRRDGTLWTAFYNAQRGYPVVGNLKDDTRFTDTSAWEFEDVGDSLFDEGYGTSIAVSDSGIVGLAYYRCARATTGLGNCSPAADDLVFAYYDGFAWTREVVGTEGTGQCGNAPHLTFDSNNRPIIVYRCEDTVDGRLDTQIRYATRSSAP